jgi:2-keto-4-pentenoate hydratase/2-oxohepta-3-ene-1,7-dioic acid hydratase in catechol pathway
MRLASYHLDARTSFGIVTDEAVIDLAPAFPDCAGLRGLIARHKLMEIERAATACARLPLSAIRYGLPIADPAKIVCIGRNYRDHKLNTGEIPQFPSLFVRLAQTLVPDGADLVKPGLSEQLDYEGELAVVIGKPGRHIAKAEAMSHVFGYACFNDGSVRDYQFRHSLTAGKNFESSGSFGPVIVTGDEIADPARLTLTTRLNGTEVQRTELGAMVFDIPSIIAYVSSFIGLQPGDVLATGSPTGTGFSRDPQVWLAPGDRLEISISQVGVLRNRVIAEPAR